MASGDVQLAHENGLLRQKEGHRASEGQHPHGHTGNGRVPWPPPGQRVDGVDYGEEPVHADAGYEEDGAIHVPVEGCSDHAAQDRPEDPVVATEVVGDLEGEQQGEEQVGTGQVQHVDDRRLLRPDPPGEGQHGADVDRHADQADQRVEGRHEDSGHGPLQEGQGHIRHPLLV